MSTQKNKKKISSTLLKECDNNAILEIHQKSGATQSVILRALIRFALREFKKRKFSLLELLKIGAY